MCSQCTGSDTELAEDALRINSQFCVEDHVLQSASDDWKDEMDMQTSPRMKFRNSALCSRTWLWQLASCHSFHVLQHILKSLGPISEASPIFMTVGHVRSTRVCDCDAAIQRIVSEKVPCVTRLGVVTRMRQLEKQSDPLRPWVVRLQLTTLDRKRLSLRLQSRNVCRCNVQRYA